MLHVGAMRGIVGAQMGGRGSIMNIEKLTTSLQFIGAALPAGAAGVYSAYHTYFSPEVMCQEMRNATLITLEKNIPVEAKRTLLRKEASQFEAKCGEVEPESNTIFQVALQELDRPAPARAAARAPRPVSSERSAAAPRSEAATGAVGPAGAPAAVANLGPVAAAPGGLGHRRIAQGRQGDGGVFLRLCRDRRFAARRRHGADRNGRAADLVAAAGARPERSDPVAGAAQGRRMRSRRRHQSFAGAAVGRSRAHGLPVI